MFFRLESFIKIFLVIAIIFFASISYPLQTDGVTFMQVETKVQAIASQKAGSVFTYESGVMKEIAKVPYSRFSIKTKNGEDVLERLNAKVVFSENVEGLEVLYCYSGVLEKYTVVNGEKVNLQVCKSDEITTIGYPLIDIGF